MPPAGWRPLLSRAAGEPIAAASAGAAVQSLLRFFDDRASTHSRLAAKLRPALRPN
jgi:hypothetical protein